MNSTAWSKNTADKLYYYYRHYYTTTDTGWSSTKHHHQVSQRANSAIQDQTV